MELTLKDLLKEEIEYFTNTDKMMEAVNYYNQEVLKKEAEIVPNSTKDIVKLLNNDLEWYFLLFNSNNEYMACEEYVMLYIDTKTQVHSIKSFDKPSDAIEDLDEFIDYIIDHEEDFEYWINFDSVRSQLEEEEEEE